MRKEHREETEQRTCVGTVDSSNVVHAANDEMGTIRRPCQVIDLSTARPTHMLGPPRFFILGAFVSEVRHGEFARDPKNNVAVITGRGEEFSYDETIRDVCNIPARVN